MSLELLIEKFGYLALFIGTMLEGETFVVLAGFAAQRGYLQLPLVVLIAFLGTTLTDQTLFWVGRYYGKDFLARRIKWKNQIDRIHRFLQRYQNFAIIGFRFLYGMRIVTPLVIGTSKIKSRRFVLFNIISVFLWAGIFTSGGYIFGQALALLLGDIQRYQFKIMLGVIIIASGIWIFRRVKKPKDQHGSNSK